MKTTPLMYARGLYTLEKPWIANTNKIYTCIAIRSFEDIYKQGMDVYKTYYEPIVQEGSTIGSGVFSFNEEALLKPNIITLRADDNELIYVPDTFINNVPNTTIVPYGHILAAVDLGLLPEEYPTDVIEAEIADIVLKHFGIKTTISIMKYPTVSNPTVEEHEQLTALREGAILANPSKESELAGLRQLNADLGDYILTLENAIRVLSL